MVVLAVIGPGIIAANADNDAGGVTTWSFIGSKYGYSLLWLLLVITPILAVTQEMGARMGAVTGKGLAALIRERFGIKLAAFAMLTLLIANFGTSLAEFAGISSAFGLFGVPSYVAVPIVAVAIWLLLTRGSFRKVERVLLALCCIYLTYFVSGILAGPDWGTALKSTVTPSMQLTSIWFLTVIAAIGTTITPWGQFFIQAYVADKHIGLRDYRYTRREVYVGAVITDLVDYFIVLACAATLFAAGKVVTTAADAAQALSPLAGPAAEWLYGIGLLNVSILGAFILPLTTAYAICEAFGFESGVDRSFREAPVFNGIITAFIAIPALIMMLPEVPLVPILVLSQDVNGVLLPVILIYVLKIINDRRVMGDHVNGPVYNVVAWAFSVVLIGLSVILVASSFPGVFGV